MAVPRERVAKARKKAFFGAGVFLLIVLLLVALTSGIGQEARIYQLVTAALSLPFIVSGLMRFYEPGIPLSFTRRHTQRRMIDGEYDHISYDTGERETVHFTPGSALLLAFGPTVWLYGFGLMLTLWQAEVIPIGGVAAYALLVGAAPFVIFGVLGPLRRLRLALDLRKTPGEASGEQTILAADNRHYLVRYRLRYSTADNGVQKLLVALSNAKADSARQLLQPHLDEAFESWRPGARRLKDPSKLATDKSLLRPLMSDLEPLGLHVIDMQFESVEPAQAPSAG